MNIKERGFTLVEMLVVIVVLGIMVSIGSVLMMEGFNSYFKAKDYSTSDWQARVAMARMTRELRSATSGGLTISPANEITFIDTNNNSIRYYRSGNILMRNTQPLADGISGLSFSYLQNNGRTNAANAATVYYITVGLTASSGSINQQIRATIHPRNIP